jgi:hypothetical protein
MCRVGVLRRSCGMLVVVVGVVVVVGQRKSEKENKEKENKEKENKVEWC